MQELGSVNFFAYSNLNTHRSIIILQGARERMASRSDNTSKPVIELKGARLTFDEAVVRLLAGEDTLETIRTSAAKIVAITSAHKSAHRLHLRGCLNRCYVYDFDLCDWSIHEHPRPEQKHDESTQSQEYQMELAIREAARIDGGATCIVGRTLFTFGGNDQFAREVTTLDLDVRTPDGGEAPTIHYASAPVDMNGAIIIPTPDQQHIYVLQREIMLRFDISARTWFVCNMKRGPGNHSIRNTLWIEDSNKLCVVALDGKIFTYSIGQDLWDYYHVQLRVPHECDVKRCDVTWE